VNHKAGAGNTTRLTESTTVRRVKYRIGGTLCRLPGTTVRAQNNDQQPIDLM
jgi:hypothetical protein